MAWHRWHFRNRLCWKRLAVTLLRNTAKPALCQIRLPLFPSASHFHSPLPSSLSFSLSPHPFLACSLFFSLSLVLRSRCNVILLCFQHVVFKMKRDKNCFCGENTYISIYQTVTNSETSVDDPFSRQDSRRPAVTLRSSKYSSCVFGVRQGSILDPLRILVSAPHSRTRNPQQQIDISYTWKDKGTRATESLTRSIKTHITSTNRISGKQQSRMYFLFYMCVCVRVFLFIQSQCQRKKTITFQLMYIPCRERELTSDFDHVLSGGK